MHNRAILVTGAGGSIGSALCARVLALEPAKLVMLNLTEHGLAALARQIQTCPQASIDRCVYVLGSVLDEVLLSRIMEGIDLVIHTAAYKHVPICEPNPCVAVQNNIDGSRAVFEAARAAGVQQCLFVSTDKAVAPASVMGATKYIAERLVAGLSSPGYRTSFLTVRFGNVLDSAGSVLPLWREQIARGGPVTITDPRCERYFMTVDDACTLILATLAFQATCGTFVFDMGPPRNLLDLATEVIAASASPATMLVDYIGLRPGEKLTEQLTYSNQMMPTAHPKVFAVDQVPPLHLRDKRLTRLLMAAYSHQAEETCQLLWQLVKGS